MKIDVSILTGVIYAHDKKTKTDVTEDAILAVTIRMMEGHYSDLIVKSEMTGKKYKLSLKEIENETV